MENLKCLVAWMIVIALTQHILPRAHAQSTLETKPLAPIKIVLVGDSTVAPGGGWGQEFAALLKPQAQCVNVASPGRSSKSYRDEGRWKKALEQKPNYIFIQFGHNDMPGKGPERETDPQTTYPENLAHYVKEARAIGAKPLLVTPLTRRFWTADGRNKSDLIPYAQAAMRVAEENQVPLVDLHARSVEQFNAIGRVAAKQYDLPGADPAKPDATHLSEFGARATALLVAREVQRVEPELGKYVNLPSVPVLADTSPLWGKNGENWSPQWSTWWNIRAAQPQVYPDKDFGPDNLNFVGLPSPQVPILNPQGRWFEPLVPQGLLRKACSPPISTMLNCRGA